MPDHCKLAWLAGIIDGEGCFSIFRHCRGLDRAGQPYEHTSASITITNSCAALLDMSRSILADLGIKHTYLQPRNSHTPAAQAHPDQELRDLGALDAVDAHIVGKAEQAALMRDFCERASATGRASLARRSVQSTEPG